MFLASLPIVGLTAVGALPRSGAVTSVVLPKLAEQGFGVPVRRIDGDYGPAFEERIRSLLGHPHLVGMARLFSPPLDQQIAPLKTLALKRGAPVGKRKPALGTVLSDYLLDKPMLGSLLHLLRLKEELDLESAGRTDFFNAQYARPAPRWDAYLPPYFHLLYELEVSGVLLGIQYVYDDSSERRLFPPYKDQRTILVDSDRLYADLVENKRDIHRMLNPVLAGARDSDSDAVPLHDFFQVAYQRRGPHRTRGLEKHTTTFVAHGPGRSHPVRAVTMVRAI